MTIANLAISGKYSTTPILNQEGFSVTTSMVVTNDNVLTAAAMLGNPFPTGYQQPAGSSQRLSTFLGQTVSFLNPSVQNPYSIRWNSASNTPSRPICFSKWSTWQPSNRRGRRH